MPNAKIKVVNTLIYANCMRLMFSNIKTKEIKENPTIIKRTDKIWLLFLKKIYGFEK